METTEAQPISPHNVGDGPIGCPKCGKVFKNGMGLRMHDIRKHKPGGGWNTAHNFQGRKKGKEEQLRKKRDYNRKLRLRYYAEGKNSRGELMPLGWVPRTGKGWSTERRAKFNSTWRSKNIQKGKKTLKRFEPIVYPDPRQKAMEEEAIKNTWPEGSGTLAKLKYCPNCGEHIEGWRHQP